MDAQVFAGRWLRPNLHIIGHRFIRGVTLIALAALVMGVLGPSVAAQEDTGEPGAAPGSAIVTFETADGSTFRAALTDPADVALTLEALSGDGYAGIPNGQLAPGDGGVNSPHEWHMVGTTLAEMTIELCDGTARMVDEDLDYWLNIVGQFCPWSAIVLEVQLLDNDTEPNGPAVGPPVNIPEDPGLEPPAGDTGTDDAPTTLPTTGTGTASTSHHAPKSMLLVIVGLAALAGFIGTQRATHHRTPRRADVRIRDDHR